jgi:hypothetical protein
MRLTIHPLTSIMTTGMTMGRLSTQYAYDAVDLCTMSLQELHDLIRSWDYVADPRGLEWVQRPLYTILGSGPCRDCDDRAIVVGAYAELNGLPFRFVAVGNRPGRPHHVFCEVLVGEDWIVVDATYPHDRLNMPRTWGHRQIIYDRRNYAG